MKDGVILMYMKEGVIYPVAMTEEQWGMLQLLAKTFEPIKVIFSEPQGEAINLTK
jgi:hypothetical protein